MEPDRFIEIQPARGSPEISFLMPIYQQARYVRAAVQSALAQQNVVAEILISDDASSDDTIEIAKSTVLEWIAGNDCPHRIVLRRGSTRLWRDHLPLLAEAATCDVVCQAHGDDLSHPRRGSILLSVFRKQPKAVLVASGACAIDADGAIIGDESPIGSSFKARRLPFKVIIEGHPDLIGFSQAWRRQNVAVFPRLDRSRAAVGHDRILPFRAAIVGEVYLVEAQLVHRRDHPMAAHHLMFEEPDTNGRFGWNLSRVVSRSAMLEDLAHAWQQGLVTKEQRDNLGRAISDFIVAATNRIADAYRKQMLAGRQIAWVDDDAMLKLRAARSHRVG